MRIVNARPICPRQVAAFLAAAMLVACLVDGNVHPVVAESSSVIRQTAEQQPDNRSDVLAKRGMPATTATAAEPASIASRARVYIFRGALGPFFSRGMDHLTERLQSAGIRANVYEFTICSLIASAAITDYRENPGPIVLIGHSMGGRCALLFAEILQAEGMPVSLVVTIDPAHMSPDVSLNVEHFINIFLSNDVLGGGDIKPSRGFRGSYASYDLAQHDEISHITIDKLETIHQQLIAKIMQLATAPAKAEDEAIPLRYVVPRSEEIELWDSGMTVQARSRDTLQTLALRYRLPQWSLTQINQIRDNAPLTTGERIIVPRYLAPLTTASAPMASRP